MPPRMGRQQGPPGADARRDKARKGGKALSRRREAATSRLAAASPTGSRNGIGAPRASQMARKLLHRWQGIAPTSPTPGRRLQRQYGVATRRNPAEVFGFQQARTHAVRRWSKTGDTIASTVQRRHRRRYVSGQRHDRERRHNDPAGPFAGRSAALPQSCIAAMAIHVQTCPIARLPTRIYGSRHMRASVASDADACPR